MNILNLYSGLGGNRKLWTGHEITAVELEEDIGNIYKQNFPDDTLVIGDAHQYLLDHAYEYDFIWSSPPCQTQQDDESDTSQVKAVFGHEPLPGDTLFTTFF